jgi:hypothetical protein
MSLGGFTLADRLGAKTVPCRVSGCTRTWIQLSNKALALGGGNSVDPSDPTAGMCEPCRNKWKSLRDLERPCERPGCENTWTWPSGDQLQAFATRRPPPRSLCAECEGRLASLETKEIPCAAPGCTRVAVISPRQQLMKPEAPPVEEEAAPAEENGKKQEPARKGITVAGPLCNECTAIAPKIKDKPVSCGIQGCTRKWLWKADEQLQFFATGKPDVPPRRMCDDCRAHFGKLLDREVRCRTSGCKKTWTWSRSDQLDACVAGKAPPKAPARMCESCFETFSHTKDVERPCRRAGCKGTWTDKRGAQLARAVRGKTGDPYPRYCGECEKELGDLQDREINCKTDNCPGTWTWTKEQQLAAGVKPKKLMELEEAEAAAAESAEAAKVESAPKVAAVEGAANGETAAKAEGGKPEGRPGKKKRNRKRRREVQPPERRCSACAEFLASKKTLEIPCSQCATPIYWPPESQLQTHLGNWAMPSMCGACKRDATEAARQVEKEALRASHPQPGEAHAHELAAQVAAEPPAPDTTPTDGTTSA